MVRQTVRRNIKKYLKYLPKVGIHPTKAILYGSYAKGTENKWSDIDIVVVAPEFDRKYKFNLVLTLWGARDHADIRLEPIPCGEKEWESGDGRPIIEVARKEGIVIQP